MARNPLSHYNNLAPARPVNSEADVKAEFARRLEAHRVRKGWNQSELARNASKYLPKPEKGQKQGHGIGRDLISHYSRGIALPRPENLEALARALGIKPADLMPVKGVPTVGGERPAWHMQTLEDGRVQVHMNRTMTMSTAIEVMSLLQKEDAVH